MATAAASDEASMKLKIFVDKKKNKVVFAESENDFVDFIFHILSLPLVAVQRILTKTSSTFGSIGTLQDGLKNLDSKYITHPAKDYLLDLKALYWGQNTTLLLPEASLNTTKEFYQCSYCKDKTVHMEENRCSRCKHIRVGTEFFGTEVELAGVHGNDSGYVNKVMTYMVLDDLTVRPAEPASFISLMNEYSIKDVGEIDKREVTFDTAQAMKLLKASVTSKTVLTDVFLGGEVKAEK